MRDFYFNLDIDWRHARPTPAIWQEFFIASGSYSTHADMRDNGAGEAGIRKDAAFYVDSKRV